MSFHYDLAYKLHAQAVEVAADKKRPAPAAVDSGWQGLDSTVNLTGQLPAPPADTAAAAVMQEVTKQNIY